MKNFPNPIRRRTILKMGATCAAVIPFYPLRKFFSTPASLSDSCIRSGNNLSRETHERLLKVALKYGSEFAEVYVKNRNFKTAKLYPKLRRRNHGSI